MYSPNLPKPGTTITSINSSSYQLSTPGFNQPGVQYLIDFSLGSNVWVGTVTLWDGASPFHVPIDYVRIWKAGAPDYQQAIVSAVPGGNYALAPGQSVTFDASASEIRTYQYGDWWHTSPINADLQAFWSINGINIAYGVNASISYEKLVATMGLSPGVYELKLDLSNTYGQDVKSTTITIVPEPTTAGMCALGAGVLQAKNARSVRDQICHTGDTDLH